jgi:pimeloyl-ACP methyl ester carboxylesterase
MAKWKLPFLGEWKTLDAEARSRAPGKFIKLPDGMVHYELAGPSDGQPVVLVHGVALPSYRWDPVFAALVKAGFRALRFDLYGRGYSDRPDVVYDKGLFDRQILNLISALEIKPPVDLLANAMGGAIAVIFTDRHPAMVRKLVLIAPAGYHPTIPRFRLTKAPVTGELLMNLIYQPMFFPERAREQMRYKGYRRALLSTLRHGPLGDLPEVYERVGKQEPPHPTLILWGRKDKLHPFESSEKIRKAMPHTEICILDDSALAPHIDQPEEVSSLAIGFLRK